jgi:type II secretory pathway component PulK
MITHSVKRRGVALIVVMVVLAAVVAVTGTLTWNTIAARRFLDRREQQFQAEWLARGGVERAQAQVARGEEPTRGTWRPLGERSEVNIRVQTENERWVIISEASYPADEPRPVTREANGVIAH